MASTGDESALTPLLHATVPDIPRIPEIHEEKDGGNNHPVETLPETLLETLLENPSHVQCLSVREMFSNAYDHVLETVACIWAYACLVVYGVKVDRLKLSTKQGLCAGLASIICVIHFPEQYETLPSIALWAVVTTDLLYEENIGKSTMRGFSHVVGTIVSSFLGFGLNLIGPRFGTGYPYFVVCIVTVGGGVLRYFNAYLDSERWTFPYFMLNAYIQPDTWKIVLSRDGVILAGFILSWIINICVWPVFAGDVLDELVATDLKKAGNAMIREVVHYMAQPLPEDEIDKKTESQTYSEMTYIVELLKAVRFEPQHGRFQKNYPFHIYGEIVKAFHVVKLDIEALHACLHADTTTPHSLKISFKQGMTEVAKECEIVLSSLARSIRKMEKLPSDIDLLDGAQGAATRLQEVLTCTRVIEAATLIRIGAYLVGIATGFGILVRYVQELGEKGSFKEYSDDQ